MYPEEIIYAVGVGSIYEEGGVKKEYPPLKYGKVILRVYEDGLKRTLNQIRIQDRTGNEIGVDVDAIEALSVALQQIVALRRTIEMK